MEIWIISSAHPLYLIFLFKQELCRTKQDIGKKKQEIEELTRFHCQQVEPTVTPEQIISSIRRREESLPTLQIVSRRELYRNAFVQATFRAQVQPLKDEAKGHQSEGRSCGSWYEQEQEGSWFVLAW